MRNAALHHSTVKNSLWDSAGSQVMRSVKITFPHSGKGQPIIMAHYAW